MNGRMRERWSGKREAERCWPGPRVLVRLPAQRKRMRGLADDTGAATAEYAITVLAAVGFAGLLVVILRSDAVRNMLTDLIHHALTFAG